MKKIFTFVATMLATASLMATQIVLQPGSDQLVTAVTNANAGDTILFQTGTYTEAGSTSPTLPAKKITLMAAEGATPTLVIYSCKINADCEINGFEIVNASVDNYLLRTGGNVDGTIAIKNCTFKLNANVSTPIGYIYLSNNSVGSLIIDNCIFTDNSDASGAILRAQQAKIGTFSMTNCTAYNMPVDHAVFCEGITNGYVDHCTFYNCGIRTVYMKGSSMNDYLVQNCIFMNSAVPESNNYCVATYAGDVKNVIYYNVNAPRSSNATITGCQNVDPQFVDAANLNFNFAFTSPLFLAATDSTHIGDPRWSVEAGTAVAIPDTLPNNVAVLAGPKIEINDDGIKWKDQNDPSLNSASWTVEVDDAVTLDVKLTISSQSTSGHQCAVALYSVDSLIVSVSEAAQCETTGEINLGTFDFPAAGKYMVRLTNATKWSSATVKSLTLSTPQSTGLSALKEKQTTKKVIVNGKMVIVHDGKAYNVLGF